MKRIWVVECSTGLRGGIAFKVFIEATEMKLHDWMKTELPEAIKYHGASEKEVESAKALKLPIYVY